MTKECPQLPAEKERPYVPGMGYHGGSLAQHMTDAAFQIPLHLPPFSPEPETVIIKCRQLRDQWIFLRHIGDFFF